MVASESEFDIYQSEAGYVAVTNPVRRQILAALAERDQELPDLMRVTGKSKPTLSNLHVRELLRQGLVQELPHATDSRRKVYRLKARLIGQSNVPLEQLRGAVKHYVTLTPHAFSVPLARVLEILLAGSAHGPREQLQAQGSALGEATAHVLAVSTARDLLTGVAGFWEQEGIARTGKIDLDHLEVEVEVQDRFCGTKIDLDALGVILSGFLLGVSRARLGGEGSAGAKRLSDRRLSLKVTPQ